MRTGEHDQLLRQGRQGWRGGCDGWRLCEIGTTLRARGVREVCLQKHGSVSSPCGGVPLAACRHPAATKSLSSSLAVVARRPAS